MLLSSVSGLDEEARYALIGETIYYKYNVEAMNYYSHKLDSMTPLEYVESDYNWLYAKYKAKAEKNLRAIKLIAAIDEQGIERAKAEHTLVNMFTVEDLKKVQERFSPKKFEDMKPNDIVFGALILDLEKERQALDKNYHDFKNNFKYMKAKFLGSKQLKQD